jgi:hypothetical protein
MTPPILNIDALDLQPWGYGVSIPGAGQASDRYQARIGFASRQLGAKKLGYNLTVLPPGKSAFPFHCHSVNEEMFFVVAGRCRSPRGAPASRDVAPLGGIFVPWLSHTPSFGTCVSVSRSKGVSSMYRGGGNRRRGRRGGGEVTGKR